MAIDPDPDLIESLQEKFTSNGPLGVYAYASGWMSAMIVRAAKEHAEHCADCQTCHDLSSLLSAVAAVQLINPPAADWLDPDRPAAPPPDLSAAVDDLHTTVQAAVEAKLAAITVASQRRMTISTVVLVATGVMVMVALGAAALGLM
jgi:hypothetical protein